MNNSTIIIDEYSLPPTLKERVETYFFRWQLKHEKLKFAMDKYLKKNTPIKDGAKFSVFSVKFGSFKYGWLLIKITPEWLEFICNEIAKFEKSDPESYQLLMTDLSNVDLRPYKLTQILTGDPESSIQSVDPFVIKTKVGCETPNETVLEWSKLIQ